MPYAIGIDVGTTNSKVALIRTSDTHVVHLERFATPKVEAEGGINFSISALMKSLMSAIAACSKALPEADDFIRFISVASVGESGVIVRSDESFCDHSLMWYDMRGSEFVEPLDTDICAKLYATVGIPAHSNYALFKILWHKAHGEDLTQATWLPLADFVVWYLTGVFGIDVSLASRLFALDISAGCISDEVLKSFDIPKSLFSALIPSGSMRGCIKSNLARDLGVDERCEVCVAGHDHMAGSVAVSLTSEGDLLNSTGTSEGLLQVVREPRLSIQDFDKRLSNGMYVEPNSYSLYASLPTAGYSLEWLARLLNISVAELFDERAEQLFMRHLSGDFIGQELMVIPHLRGSGPPNRTTYAKANIYGASETTDSDTLIYSTYLGLAFELRRLKEAMVGSDVRRIKVIGPAAQSALWMQLKADVLGSEMVASTLSEAVVRGSVLVGAKSLGLTCSCDEKEQSYLPDRERYSYFSQLYSEQYVPLSKSISEFEERLNNKKGRTCISIAH